MTRDYDVGVTSPSIVGGYMLGRWGGYATWPFVRLSIDPSGVWLGPSERWLSFMVATYSFSWDQVESVQVHRRALRFRLSERIRPRKRFGPLAWLCLRQSRIDFWCRDRDWETLTAAIPERLRPA